MATFLKGKSLAAKRQAKLVRLDSANKVDARRTKKEMVGVPHKQARSVTGEEWRPGIKWKGAKGKATRKHTPTVTR